jgi:hypothetical protein
MKTLARKLKWLAIVFGVGLLASCAQAMPTGAPTLTPTPVPFTPTPFIEERTIELEWPSQLRLGESDVLRLALVPSGDGYLARAEFGEHPLETQEAPIRHIPGYSLLGIARLDGVGFEISPSGEQRLLISPGEEAAWRWTLAARAPGQQSLTVNLTLRWEPEPGFNGPVSESLAYGRGLTVQVHSILGMTRSQATFAGVFLLFAGLGLGGVALFGRSRTTAPKLQTARPNRDLSIEISPAIRLSLEETRLIQASFSRYSRLLLEDEFKSGYSGSRAFLARPVTADGRADAETIAKVGPRTAIQSEFENYERFVKDRLPPVTARIQRPPVWLRGGELACLQYTFISKPGQPPLSLRQALLRKPDPAYLYRLMDTFGPNWWMQRQTYTFRLEQEYDRLLPPHWVVEPAPGESTRGTLADGRQPAPQAGQILRLGAFKQRELRADRQSWSLTGEQQDGQPPLRVRWISAQPPAAGVPVRIRASRTDLLRRWTEPFERFGLPDPLEHLGSWLGTTVQSTRSTIHGDLNLENVLVGPGELVWLIDFAQTREGPPLLDFSHLGAEIIAHVLSASCGSPEAFLERLTCGDELLEALEEIAGRCLFDPARKEEYHLSFALACLGALKFSNLPPLAKHCLYLSAAYQAEKIQSHQ